jgi:hypothetical protein
MHLPGSTPQNTARAQRQSPGITTFFVAPFQDNAKLVAIMRMGAELEPGVQRHGRNR